MPSRGHSIALENADAGTTLPACEAANQDATCRPARIDTPKVRVDLRNVFDETFACRSSDEIDSASVIPLNEPGRTLALTARVRF